MWKILLMLLGFALLVPSAVIFLMYLRTSDGGPVAFGIWMFFGLPTICGAIFAFREANRIW
jgi:hypothetical protein